MTELMRGAKILIESLKKEGVEVVFGYPGGVLLDIYDELYDSNLKHYLVRHEQGAAHAADGYARSTGKVGVCIATSGPGATNLVTGIANAHMDSIPMVAITGQVTTSAIGKDAFQEADITGITMPITKHNYLIKDANDIPRIVREAFYIASTGRPGPVLIDIPKDVTQAKIEFKWPKEPVSIPSYKPTFAGHIKQIKEAVRLIEACDRPLILAGGGVVSSGASEELLLFAERTRIPVSTTLMGLSSIPTDHELDMGMPGMHGTAYANYAIREADLIVAIGMRFDDRITGKLSEFAKNAKIIHVDVDPAEIGKCVRVNVPIVGDAKQVLKQLLELIDHKWGKDRKEKLAAWDKQLIEWKKKHPLRYKTREGVIAPQYVLGEINRITQGEAIYATEVGQNQMWACQYLKFKRPRTWLSSGGLGTMGYGLPAAIGAQVGNPDKLVIDIAGDGSFQMNLNQLGMVEAYNIPVKIVILNNGVLGMVRQWQTTFYKKRYSHTDILDKQPDFVKLAEAYGLLGLRATKPNEVGPALEKAFKHKGAAIVDCLVDKDACVYPFVPPGGTVEQMMLEDWMD